MQLSIRTKHDSIKIEEAEGVTAASDAFPYWMIRYKEDSEGKTRVRFFSITEVLEVEMYGSEEKEEPKLASVTPIRPVEDSIWTGGDEDGTA